MLFLEAEPTAQGGALQVGEEALVEWRELSCARECEHGKSQVGRAPVSAVSPGSCLVLGLGEQPPVRGGGGLDLGPGLWRKI